jgi:glucokinase
MVYEVKKSASRMILAGDIGGTKTHLAIFQDHNLMFQKSFPSQHYTNLETLITEFLKGYQAAFIERACFAIAGPVIDGVCHTTNLPWIVEGDALAKTLQISQVTLLNDLEANAWAIAILPSAAFHTLHSGSGKKKGNRAIISPGTGLGEAGLYWDGKHHTPFAGEGGHCEFAPRNSLQMDLCRFLWQSFGHASYERILSGPGLHNIYLFFKKEIGRSEPDWLRDEMAQNDPAAVITRHALNQTAELCVDTLNLFLSILGAEAGNLALKFMATGGVYLGGGIPPKILPLLKEPLFLTNFFDKGRFQSLLTTIPVHVILDDTACLKGAAYCAGGGAKV